MEHDNDNHSQRNDVFSKRIRAGKRRTYFFDVRTTKGNDYYLTITESKKRFNDDGYDRHKVFIYKEDFNKFIHTLEEVVDHIKNNLMPEYDFDEFTRDPEDITYDGSDHSSDEHDDYYNEERTADSSAKDSNESVSQISSNNSSDDEEVMKWD
ncbi:MAG: DUF3276 family protein [Bacteroidetes bacterium]|nr:DUF3276 family protein [Bacteroidota bacterium]